jgi:hypothetical protein
MSDDSTSTTGGAGQQTGIPTIVVVDPELKIKFPEIIDLIMQSESMNNGERQYWIDILPAMSPEQVKQLHDILQNERVQLAAIDAKYAKEIQAVGTASIEQTEEARMRKRQDLGLKETAMRSAEEKEAEDILKQVQDV